MSWTRLFELLETIGIKVKGYNLSTSDFTQANLSENNLVLETDVNAVAISNDGTSDITVTILTKTYTIKPGEIRELKFPEQFNTVGFSAGAVFRCVGMIS